MFLTIQHGQPKLAHCEWRKRQGLRRCSAGPLLRDHTEGLQAQLVSNETQGMDHPSSGWRRSMWGKQKEESNETHFSAAEAVKICSTRTDELLLLLMLRLLRTDMYKHECTRVGQGFRVCGSHIP